MAAVEEGDEPRHTRNTLFFPSPLERMSRPATAIAAADALTRRAHAALSGGNARPPPNSRGIDHQVRVP